MKRRLVWTIFAITVVLFSIAGCKLPFWSELIGTWVYSSTGTTVSLTFDSQDMTYEMVGTYNGKIVFSLDEVDEHAHHFIATLKSETGDLIGEMGDVGEVRYFTYSISSEAMYIDFDESPYPPYPPTLMGPFTRQ